MTQRDYDFLTAIETPNQPVVADPASGSDSINSDYLDNRWFWAASVADYAALRGLIDTMRRDDQRRVVHGTQEEWYFDAASTAVDDGATILKPSDLTGGDPGRWLIAASAGGGGGAGSSGIETLMQKVEAEKLGILTEPLDNSVGQSGLYLAEQQLYKATLIKGQTAADTSIEVVWNAEAVNQSDQNMDATTGWTATGQGASLTASTTAGDFQVGSAGLKFDKGGGGTEAAIRYDTGSQTRQFNGKSRVWAYVKLPSITNLTNIVLRIYADSTSNFQTFTKTTQFDGSALAIGWNLLVFDISTGGSAGGTGWDISKLCRYIEVGVTATSGQTYTGIIFDSVYFSYYRPQEIGVIGNEFTLFNNSTKEDVVFSASNTLHDGRLTLVSALSNTIVGGLSGTARGRVQRSTVLISGDIQMPMDNDSTFSGSVTLAQELRIATFCRETISGSAMSFVDLIGVQAYAITTVGGSTIGIDDPSDTHLNLLNTDPIDFFRPVYINGKAKYDIVASRSLTANSTATGGITTLTVVTTSLAVGDIAVKRHLTASQYSATTETGAEVYTGASIASSPDGVQLIDTALAYPNRSSLLAHYYLGGTSSTDATRNRAAGTAGVALTTTGTVATNGSFQKGRFAVVGNANNTDYLGVPSPSAQFESHSVMLQTSFWLYFDGTNGSSRGVFSRHDGGTAGFTSYINGSSNILTIQANGTASTLGTLSVGWNHVVLVIGDTGSIYGYLNGVKSAVNGVLPTAVATALSILTFSTAAGYIGSGLRAADMVIWSGGSPLTQAQVNQLYNGGMFRPVGFGPLQRFVYKTTGVSGQKIGAKFRVNRSTTAIVPTIWKAGILVG